MQIQINDPILDVRGRPVKDGDGIEITLRDLIMTALSLGHDNGKAFSVASLANLTRLGRLISKGYESGENAGKVDLKTEDIVLIKELVCKLPDKVGLNPLVAGIALELLEPKPSEPKEA